ncbi:CoA-dependent acyltransferase [Pluteus cervinus]|uniref:CoA-dependent acyltransferase n=1 Tax=Pluteus cervinus TaxID=181527 RepID=A0ACD3ACC4_9AGAR|nr:CoA-dependent acyltransferase [Pluteus cervinus]
MFVRPLRRLLGRPQLVSYFHSTPSSWASRKVIQKFQLADIGEGITECEVIKWSVKLRPIALAVLVSCATFWAFSSTVKPASRIQAFDPLCEVQSDKASVEITSPFDGVVKELLVQEGEVAKVGAGLCLIEVEEEVDEAETSSVDAPQAPQTSSTAPTQAAPESEPPSPPVQQESQSQRKPHPLDPNVESRPLGNQVDVLAAPSVRHYARQYQVDLAKLSPGSGRDGRIEKADVDAYLSGSSSSKSVTTGSSTPLVPQEGDVVVELGRTRYGMWKAMVKSLDIPHFGYSTTLDLTALHNILPALNAHIPQHFLPLSHLKQDQLLVNPSALYPAPTPSQVEPSYQFAKLTYLPILLKTLSKSMVEWPLFRSSITSTTATDAASAKPSLTIRPQADISIALSTPTGLYTPTLQRANTQSIYGLASQLKHLSYLGRQVPCGLSPAEMPKRGGTITVSNVGAIGDGDFASPVLVPGGGVAIVAIGRAKWVWDVNRGDGTGERRLKVGISWSADHRVVEGAELAAFVECWRAYVEQPERLIADSV